MTLNWCQGPWLHMRTKTNYSHVEIQILNYTLVTMRIMQGYWKTLKKCLRDMSHNANGFLCRFILNSYQAKIKSNILKGYVKQK